MTGARSHTKGATTRLRLLAFLVVVALAALGCGSEDSGGTTEAGGGGTADKQIELVAKDFSFDTTDLSLEPGSSVEVTLVNEGSAEHTFTSDDLDVEVEAEGGASASTTFDAPDEEGTFEFHCHYHPDQMKGTITVGAGGEAPAGGGGGMEHEKEEKEDDSGGYDY
jgi:plastocyanin